MRRENNDEKVVYSKIFEICNGVNYIYIYMYINVRTDVSLYFHSNLRKGRQEMV
jgi:hypothetical protein